MKTIINNNLKNYKEMAFRLTEIIEDIFEGDSANIQQENLKDWITICQKLGKKHFTYDDMLGSHIWVRINSNYCEHVKCDVCGIINKLSKKDRNEKLAWEKYKEIIESKCQKYKI